MRVGAHRAHPQEPREAEGIRRLDLCTERKRASIWLTSEARFYVADNVFADDLITDGIPVEDREGIVFADEPRRFFALLKAAYEEPFSEWKAPRLLKASTNHSYSVPESLTRRGFFAYPPQNSPEPRRGFDRTYAEVSTAHTARFQAQARRGLYLSYGIGAAHL